MVDSVLEQVKEGLAKHKQEKDTMLNQVIKPLYNT